MNRGRIFIYKFKGRLVKPFSKKPKENKFWEKVKHTPTAYNPHLAVSSLKLRRFTDQESGTTLSVII